MSPHRSGAVPSASSSPEANAADLVKSLTDREREVLSLIGLGLSMAEIAQRLSRTVKTVEWYRAALGKKLRSKNRVQLARIAIAAKLIEDPSATGRLSSVSPTEARWKIAEAAMLQARAFACQWDEASLSLAIAGDLGAALGYGEDELGEHSFILQRLAEQSSIARMFKLLQDHVSTSADQPFDTHLDLYHRHGHLERLRWRGRVTGDDKGRASQWLALAVLEGPVTHAHGHKPAPRPAPGRIGAIHWLAETDMFHADVFYHRLIGLPKPAAPGSIQSSYLACVEPRALADVRQRWNAALAGRGDELTLEVPRRCADGVVRRFRDELVICRDQQRRPTRVRGAVILVD